VNSEKNCYLPLDNFSKKTKLKISSYRYDDEADRVSFYQYVPLEDITQVEIGQCQLSSNSIFKTSKAPASFCIRIYYQQRDDNGEMEPGFFHIFRSSNLRFFNNLAVAINSEDEATGKNLKFCFTIIRLFLDFYCQDANFSNSYILLLRF
jgi:Inositol phosphatase